MAKKKYESIQVAVPRGKRIVKITLASLYCIFGLAALVVGVIHKDETALAGALMLAVGIFALIKFKATHEPQLTEQGKAAKAADDVRAKRRDDAFGSLMWSLVVIGAIAYFAPAIFDAVGGEVRIYPISCPSWDYESNNCTEHKWVPRGVRHFIIHSSQQLVIASWPDDDLPPARYYNCAVVDRLNWACTVAANPNSASIRMNHGVLVDLNVGDDPSVRYTSRWRWWETKWSK